MKRYLVLLFFLVPCGCWSRPCRVADSIPPPPCRAKGSDSEGWRIATAICRDLEATGAEVAMASVNGTHLELRFAPAFGQQLLADEAALRQTVAGFLSIISRQTGAVRVSVEVFSGDTAIAIGETIEAGEERIEILP